MNLNLTNPETIKKIMDGLGIRFNKALGQNFLIDQTVLDSAIDASGIDEGYGVIEVGPGIGVLTYELSQVSKKVVKTLLNTFKLYRIL